MNMAAERPAAAAQIAGMIFAVLLIDAGGMVVEANPAAESLLGKSAKRMAGLPVSEVLDLADTRVVQRLADGDAALVARNIGLNVNGHEQRVNLTASPLPAHPGWRVLTLSETGRNDDQHEEASDVTALVAPAVLAHEIKNPLAAIRGAGQLVARKLEPEDRPLARMITDEVDRIARLIDRMQQLGSSLVDPTGPCNLHEAIRSAIATVRAAGSEGVEIVEEFDPSLPPVLASRDALEQVLINLISNARDAARANPAPMVTVKTRFASGLVFSAIRLGRSVKLPVEITVTDNGPGIDEKLRDHVFEPFVTSKKSGQGLGLALVRKLVRDMNGRIGHQRDSVPGLTHFRLHLPLAREGTEA